MLLEIPRDSLICETARYIAISKYQIGLILTILFCIYRNLDITHDGRQLPEPFDVEEDEIEESIKEEILETSTCRGTKHIEKQNDQNGDKDLNNNANPFNNKTNSNMKTNATPNTILSNKQKLNRGVSRDSEYVNNGTLINFGLAGQSTRSTFMKTPLMFG